MSRVSLGNGEQQDQLSLLMPDPNGDEKQQETGSNRKKLHTQLSGNSTNIS